MKIHAEPVRGADLQPGDLFSTAGPMNWHLRDRAAIGEKVYIRTEAPCPMDQADNHVYRITIER